MSLRSILLAIALLVVAVFAVINWIAFTRPTTLSLVFATIEAPLGLIMLGVTGVLSALFIMFAMYLQTSALLESRRSARELQAQRELADHAEASRFTELHGYIAQEQASLRTALETMAATLISRHEATDQALQKQFQETTNTLSAYIGEVEDKLERKSVSRTNSTEAI